MESANIVNMYKVILRIIAIQNVYMILHLLRTGTCFVSIICSGDRGDGLERQVSPFNLIVYAL